MLLKAKYFQHLQQNQRKQVNQRNQVNQNNQATYKKEPELTPKEIAQR